MIQVGEKAPDYLGRDENGREVRLSDFAGKKVVIYFYPKDSTPGCTSEACNLRDNYHTLMREGYAVVGVSVDSEQSHRRFKEKYELPFPLISDTEKQLVQQFGVWGEKKMAGRTYFGVYRTTFIISEDGTVERVIGPKEIKVKNHTAQILTQ